MFKQYKKFQNALCPHCISYRARPYCDQSAMPKGCPWKGQSIPERWPGEEGMKVCACCGKDIYVPYPTKYVYKRMHHTSARNQITDFYCGWNCMRKEEKIIDRICNELELPGC